MKSALTIFLIFVFVSIAVFGFFAMGTESTHEIARCIASLTGGGRCPPESDAVSFAVFHFDAFQKFSESIPGWHTLFVILLFLSLLSALAADLLPGKNLKRAAISALQSNFAVNHRKAELPISQRLEFAQWLVLHENSPSLS